MLFFAFDRIALPFIGMFALLMSGVSFAMDTSESKGGHGNSAATSAAPNGVRALKKGDDAAVENIMAELQGFLKENGHDEASIIQQLKSEDEAEAQAAVDLLEKMQAKATRILKDYKFDNAEKIELHRVHSYMGGMGIVTSNIFARALGETISTDDRASFYADWLKNVVQGGKLDPFSRGEALGGLRNYLAENSKDFHTSSPSKRVIALREQLHKHYVGMGPRSKGSKGLHLSDALELGALAGDPRAVRTAREIVKAVDADPSINSTRSWLGMRKNDAPIHSQRAREVVEKYGHLAE